MIINYSPRCEEIYEDCCAEFQDTYLDTLSNEIDISIFEMKDPVSNFFDHLQDSFEDQVTWFTDGTLYLVFDIGEKELIALLRKVRKELMSPEEKEELL